MAERNDRGRPGGRGGPGGPGGPGGRFMLEVQKPKDAKGTLRRLFKYLQKYQVVMIVVFTMVLISSLLSLVTPKLTGDIIDAIKPGNVDFDRIFRLLMIMVGTFLLSIVASWLQQFLMVDVAQGLVFTLRRDVFEKVQSMPLRFFDTRSHGDIMSRITNDVELISQTLGNTVVQVFSSIITLVGALVFMLQISPLLTVLGLVSIPIGMVLSQRIMKLTRKNMKERQNVLGELNGQIEEIVSGQKAVKAFGRESQVEREFDGINLRLRNVGIRAEIYSGIMGPLMNAVNNMMFAIIAACGGWMVIRGSISVGNIASFLQYSRQLSRPINEVANQANVIQSAIAGAERVFDIMDELGEYEGEGGKPPLADVKGEVTFDHVDFGYVDGVPILKDVSLTANPGDTIALVGPTGAGKTTVINLLTRFYDVNGGSIKIDGHDIREFEKDSLRGRLGIVLQDTYLFSGSVRDNIRYGRLDATEQEIHDAAKLSNANLFIERLPDGYDTLLTEGGSNLSQGQRQLLSIARAVLAQPSILVLDEATSSVDTRTEVHIQQAMLKLMSGRTSFVIAHRLSTIRDADMILVIKDGSIIERGNHKELLRQKGFYYELHESQYKRQEELESRRA